MSNFTGVKKRISDKHEYTYLIIFKMKQIVKNEKKDIISWINWLNIKWNDYEVFSDFEFGDNPQEVAENFFFLNQRECIEFLQDFDSEDFEALEQLQKLAESESHVFKIIRNQIKSMNKVKYVDFKKKRGAKINN